MSSRVQFFRQDYQLGQIVFAEIWDIKRKLVCEFSSPFAGEAAAEQCFKIFNAPPSALNEFEQNIAAQNRGPSMSVGDIAEVDGVQYLCCAAGWKTKTHEKK